ncbi:shikimate dehydrogenase [Swingsia samuiensis]|uniref:Shikimate dehydrogenase (NADP(+)) n=1 Tax=Swingsia samuiensis TaxID=1293412 RepID=A0A4Y6UIW1_9PROT|nr:shikimate dehydrogenase [Swingsia samuiensis]QDH16760.1 shikimate dehydrogenase [Swingsia samuiensis]
MSERSFLSILTGSFSSPSKGNPTVAMIEAGYKATGLNARYINCDVPAERLGNAIKGAVAMGWVGFNCSIPHKVAILEHLDELAESARLIGAVNCTAIKDGRLIGHNTDGKGFLESLKTVTDPSGKNVLILGAGGAARAIAVETALAGAKKITIVNRKVEKAKEIAKIINDNTDCESEGLEWSGDYKIPQDIDILINATPIGFGDAEALPPVDFESLRKEVIVADVIPNPPKTHFLRKAEERGCKTLNGLGMLVNQGRIGVNIWLGKMLDADVMTKTLRDIFEA